MKKQKYPNTQFKGPAKVGTFMSEPLPVRPESDGWVNPWKQPCRTCEHLTTFDGSLFCRIREDFTRGSTTGCGDWEKGTDV